MRTSSVPQTVLEQFWRLAEIHEKQREGAIATLAAEVERELEAAEADTNFDGGEFPPLIDYIIKRLIRGLSSGRAAARQGYAAALAACLQAARGRITLKTVLGIIDGEMESVSSSSLPNEAREIYTGKVFGHAAVAHAATSMPTSEAEIQDVAERLIANGRKRDYLLEPASEAVLVLANSESEERSEKDEAIHKKKRKRKGQSNEPPKSAKVEDGPAAAANGDVAPAMRSRKDAVMSSESVRSMLEDQPENAEPEAIQLATGFNLNGGPLPDPNDGEQEWARVRGAMEASTRVHPRLHTAWSGLENRLKDSSTGLVPRERLAAFWHGLVDQGLLQSTRERRHAGLEVGRKLAHVGEPGSAAVLMTTNLARTAADHVSKGGRLKQAAERTLEAIFAQEGAQEEALEKLKQEAGARRVDSLRRKGSKRLRELLAIAEEREASIHGGEAEKLSKQLREGSASEKERAASEVRKAWRRSDVSLEARERLMADMTRAAMSTEVAGSERTKKLCAERVAGMLASPGSGWSTTDLVKEADFGERWRRLLTSAEKAMEPFNLEAVDGRRRVKDGVVASREEGIRLFGLVVLVLHGLWPNEYTAELGELAENGSLSVGIVLSMLGKGRYLARAIAERAFRAMAKSLRWEDLDEVLNALVAPASDIFAEEGGDEEEEEEDDDENRVEQGDEVDEGESDGRQPVESAETGKGKAERLHVERDTAWRDVDEGEGDEGDAREEDNPEEEEMLRMDDLVSEALRSKRNKGRKEKKAAEFRFRVVALVEALAKQAPESPHLPFVALRVLEAASKRGAEGFPSALGTRLAKLAETRLAKLPSSTDPPLTEESSTELLQSGRQAFEIAARAREETQAKAAQALSHYIARVLWRHGKVSGAAGHYATALKESCSAKKTRLGSGFFASAAERIPELGPRLLPSVLDEAASWQAAANASAARRCHVAVELSKLCPAMLRRAEGGQEEAAGRFAEALPGLIKSGAQLKAKKRAELVRALAEAAELAVKRGGMKAVRGHVDATAIEEATAPLVDAFSPAKLSRPARRIRSSCGVDPS